MPSQTSLDKVQEIYIAFYGRPADPEGQNFWALNLDQNEGDLTAIINDFATSDEFQDRFADLTNEELVNNLYQQAFGRDAEAEGLAFYVATLESGANTLGTIALEIVGGAQNGDLETITNKIEVADAFTAAVAAESKDYSGPEATEAAKALLDSVTAETDPASVDVASVVAGLGDAPVAPVEPEEPTEPTVPGEDFFLTSGTDVMTGTSGDDKFYAYLQQNPMFGGISNSLSSADRLDGGAGSDYLFAEVTSEFVGAAAMGLTDIQPRTTSIEVVEFEARDFAGAGGQTITIDAKHMYGVEKIGSKQSDGNLVIENLTTLRNDGTTKRNTSEMTITMDHTDNTNSDGDASDLTVYFDDNYLITDSSSEFRLEMRIVNPLTLANDDQPLTGFTTVTFSVGDQEVFVDISEETTYAGVASAINNELAAQGISDVEATVQPLRQSVFSDDVQGYQIGQLAGDYNPVLITSTNEELTRGPVTESSDVEDMNTFNTWVEGASTSDNPLSVNVELTKVGRGGIGGDLEIGAKSLMQGINVFDVTVMGDSDLPNNLGTLSTTAGDLETVNIVSEAGRSAADIAANGYASLTIRDGFAQESLGLVNADGFFGDLTLGNGVNIVNLETLTATGGGDVEYWSTVGANAFPGLDSLGNLDYSATTGAGDDTFVSQVLNGAQMTINAGAGNDTVFADVTSQTDSGSTRSSITVVSMSGDNEVVLSSGEAGNGIIGGYDVAINEAFVTTGEGTDIVTGGGTHLTASTGAGNDVIYAENTGAKAETVASIYSSTQPLNVSTRSYVVDDFMLLAGRDLLVTVAVPGNVDSFVNGFEVGVRVDGQRGTLSTLDDYNNAVLRAINEHPVVQHIAEARVTSNDEIIVEYKVDGDFAGNVAAVQIDVRGTAADTLTAAQQASLLNALRAEYSDSGIAAADVVSLFDGVTNPTNLVAGGGEFANQFGSNSVTVGSNVINAGTGNDVVVLSSANADQAIERFDTVEFDAGNFGNDTIVHFQSGAAGDVLDFTDWLNTTASVSGSAGSVSQQREDTAFDNANTVAGQNSVAVIDFTTLNTANVTAANFDAMLGLNNANLTTLVNDTFTVTGVGSVASKHIFMIQNDANEGQYAVVQAETVAANADLTNITLVGTLDFGTEQSFVADNFA